MTGYPSTSTPGNEDRRYLVFAPGSGPFAGYDMPITEAFAAIGALPDAWMDLIIRLAVPERVTTSLLGGLWHRVRVTPGEHTLERVDEFRVRFSGTARLLDHHGEPFGDEYIVAGTVKIKNESPADILGELKFSVR